jgi:flagellar hook-length control protein FliK
MLESPVVQKLIKAEIQEKWVLTPQDLAGGSAEMSKYYNGLNNNLHKFERLLQILNQDITGAAGGGNAGKADESLQAQAKNVRDNLTIMNEIGKTMPFLQIPLKLSSGGGITNSDLYIFNNKKRRTSSPVRNVNAMIKLELENMGDVNIYINVAGRSARARFISAKDEAVEEIANNLPELNEAIHSLGFNFTSTAVQTEKEQEFDILDDFINREVPKTEMRKYILRKKI